MKRTFAFLLSIVFCFFTFLSIPVVSAMPGNTNCSNSPNNFCDVSWQWNGNVHGASLYFAPRHYTEVGGTNGNYGQMFLDLNRPQGSGLENVFIGEDNGRGSAGGSGCSNNHQEYFWEIDDAYGTFLAGQCYTIPSGDYNNSVYLQASYYTSNGGGVIIEIKGPSTNVVLFENYGGTNNYWSNIQLDTFVESGNVNNCRCIPTNFMPSQDMVTNKWQCDGGSCNGQWKYQTGAPNLTTQYSPPPQTSFSPDQYGGDMTACASGGTDWNSPCTY